MWLFKLRMSLFDLIILFIWMKFGNPATIFQSFYMIFMLVAAFGISAYITDKFFHTALPRSNK